VFVPTFIVAILRATTIVARLCLQLGGYLILSVIRITQFIAELVEIDVTIQ
jgi:hypothetical protein